MGAVHPRLGHRRLSRDAAGLHADRDDLRQLRGREQVRLWTFAVLFAARISAKLNLYLGVRKINVEFIPEHLNHLPSHFRTARMNWLFPISITGLSVAAAYLARPRVRR
jgi:putative photosynthetic complex assembly protein 2